MNYKMGDFIYLMSRVVSCVSLAMIIAWRFSILLLVVIPFIGLCNIITILVNKKYTSKEMMLNESAAKLAGHTLSSIKTVFALGLERKFIDNYADKLKIAEKMTKRKALFAGLFGGLAAGLQSSFFALGIYITVVLINRDCILFGPFNIIPSFFGLITASLSLSQCLVFLKDLNDSKMSAAKIFKMIEPKSAANKNETIMINDIKGKIEFRNVYFSYSHERKVYLLKNFTLEIKSSKTVALVEMR